MTAAIHPTAIVSPEAELGEGVAVGPYAIVGAGVAIGAGTSVGAHATIEGPTVLGRENRVFPHAVLGFDPQDLKYHGEKTWLKIGDHNVFREFSTAHRGTVTGRGETTIGDRNYFMAYSHVAHDCRIGSSAVFANSASLAGHVDVGDHVVLGAFVGAHQFTRIGRLAFVSGGAMVTQDVPPYVTVQGDRAEVVGINTVGLTRARFDEHAQARVKAAYKIVFRSKMGLREAVAHVKAEFGGHPEIDHFVSFLEGTERGIAR